MAIQFKRGSTEAWASLNPVLAPGEPGFDRTSGTLKIGDGQTAWNDLPPVGSPQIDLGDFSIDDLGDVEAAGANADDALVRNDAGVWVPKAVGASAPQRTWARVDSTNYSVWSGGKVQTYPNHQAGDLLVVTWFGQGGVGGGFHSGGGFTMGGKWAFTGSQYGDGELAIGWMISNGQNPNVETAGGPPQYGVFTSYRPIGGGTVTVDGIASRGKTFTAPDGIFSENTIQIAVLASLGTHEVALGEGFYSLSSVLYDGTHSIAQAFREVSGPADAAPAYTVTATPTNHLLATVTAHAA